MSNVGTGVRDVYGEIVMPEVLCAPGVALGTRYVRMPLPDFYIQPDEYSCDCQRYVSGLGEKVEVSKWLMELLRESRFQDWGLESNVPKVPDVIGISRHRCKNP